MLFNIKEFIMKTLLGMIGNYPDFQIREYALNWYSKGKITEDDLAHIELEIETQYTLQKVEETVEEELEQAEVEEE